MILLPYDIEDESTGLEQLEKQFTSRKLQQWMQPEKIYFYNEIYVHLPKFKLEERYKLYLATLGVQDVFDSDKADLSGMPRAQDLHVSKIVRKSFVEVYEEGTEAVTGFLLLDDIKGTPLDIWRDLGRRTPVNVEKM